MGSCAWDCAHAGRAVSTLSVILVEGSGTSMRRSTSAGLVRAWSASAAAEKQRRRASAASAKKAAAPVQPRVCTEEFHRRTEEFHRREIHRRRCHVRTQSHYTPSISRFPPSSFVGTFAECLVCVAFFFEGHTLGIRHWLSEQCTTKTGEKREGSARAEDKMRKYSRRVQNKHIHCRWSTISLLLV